MTMFMTKVWGFSDPSGPLQFSTRGARETARQKIVPGDVVILVGTVGEPTQENERGRILGMMEPTTEPVSSLDFDLQPRPVDFDDDGRYRWPYSLHNRGAWKFDEPLTPLAEVSDRRFSMDSAQGIVPLTPDEEARVRRLPLHEVPLLPATRASARIEGEEAARKKSAPPPTTTRTGIMHMRRAPAHTYLMLVEHANVEAYKIGWAFDFRSRQRQFNLSAMPQLGGLRFKTVLYHLWPTARAAYEMEQFVLKGFDRFRHAANREIITGVSLEEVRTSWFRYLQGLRH